MLLIGAEPEWVCFVIKNTMSILEEAEAELWSQSPTAEFMFHNL